MVMDKNNMHEVGSEFFFRYLIKACIAVLLLSYTFDITMAIFDVGNHIVTRAGGIVSGSTTIDVTDTLKTMFDSQIDTMGIGELIGAWYRNYDCQLMYENHLPAYYRHAFREND